LSTIEKYPRRCYSVRLGCTELCEDSDGFGALPLQRVDFSTAGRLLWKALDAGLSFIDTARSYSDSEEKIGRCLAHRRYEFGLATKTPARNAADFWKDLETSLSLLKTDYIDIYQFHNPAFVPRPEDGTGLYEAMLKAMGQGKVRAIGITSHRLPFAREAVESGLYQTLQFPLNYLSTEAEQALVALCVERDVGFIAMKALSGGLITDIALARAWFGAFPDALPIWGIQRESELDALIAARYANAPLDEAGLETIERDRGDLAGSFCRGCGYCMPCPEGIEINNCARMSLLLRRSPAERWLSPAWQQKMAKIAQCRHCGLCASRCPYGLDTPALLAANYADYQEFVAL
jgi:predicted aldo/keto reductase-like oxidoreductase